MSIIIKRDTYYYTFYNYLFTFSIYLFIYTVSYLFHVPNLPPISKKKKKKKGSNQQNHQPFTHTQCSLNLNIIKIPTRILP